MAADGIPFRQAREELLKGRAFGGDQRVGFGEQVGTERGRFLREPLHRRLEEIAAHKAGCLTLAEPLDRPDKRLAPFLDEPGEEERRFLGAEL